MFTNYRKDKRLQAILILILKRQYKAVRLKMWKWGRFVSVPELCPFQILPKNKKVCGVWCGAPGVRAGVAVRALFKQGRVGGWIETRFSRDGMYTLRQVRKTTLFLYLAEQPPREREEQGENGGERVLHSKWPLKSLTKKKIPSLPWCETLRTVNSQKPMCFVGPSYCATAFTQLQFVLWRCCIVIVSLSNVWEITLTVCPTEPMMILELFCTT